LSVISKDSVFEVFADILRSIPRMSTDEFDFADYCSDAEVAFRLARTTNIPCVGEKGIILYFPGIVCVKE